MITIDPEAWRVMVDHAQAIYPNECCGAMIGAIDGSEKSVKVAVPLENAFSGEQGARYELAAKTC
jgi:proteasome lid subunit RPN8/RPN11